MTHFTFMQIKIKYIWNVNTIFYEYKVLMSVKHWEWFLHLNNLDLVPCNSFYKHLLVMKSSIIIFLLKKKYNTTNSQFSTMPDSNIDFYNVGNLKYHSPNLMVSQLAQTWKLPRFYKWTLGLGPSQAQYCYLINVIDSLLYIENRAWWNSKELIVKLFILFLCPLYMGVILKISKEQW